MANTSKKKKTEKTEVVAYFDHMNINIESLIRTIRGLKVMVDFDLAMLYGVQNKRLNEQVKRNIVRFPDDFMFQLTKEEWRVLRSQIATAKDISKIRTLPYAFTRNGIGMLSSVLGSGTAIAMNIRIMRAFTASQQIMESNAILFKRVFHLEQHQQETDEKINYLISKMDDTSPKLLSEQIFNTGCVWDAWAYVSDLVRYREIHFLQLPYKNHDRFLIINDDVYLLGASVKDMGIGLRAITKMQTTPETILELLK